MLSEIDMEGIGTEEHVVVGSCNNKDANHAIKRKRTKRRLRQLSQCPVASTTVTSSCSSASGGSGGGEFSSTTFESTDQEEEDMANCLILLAQGKGGSGEEDLQHHHHRHRHNHHHQHKQQTEKATKTGFDIYECKTCNRTFPSFQALGGHRASHKKPKIQEDKKRPSPPLLITNSNAREIEEPNYKQSNMIKNIISAPPPMISLELGCGVVVNKSNNKPNKIHECSICGSEFNSGQALGGHMRRHRAAANNNNNVAVTTFDDVDVVVKSRNVLELDLNLPAPEDDVRDSTFHFPATQKSVVLSAAPALVGCHY